MKRICTFCGEKYVTSKTEKRVKKNLGIFAGDHLLCNRCFREEQRVTLEEANASVSYVGSFYI